MDPFTIMMLAKTAGKAASAIGGSVQMLSSMQQLRKAKRLPFPDYTSGMQYANENMEMYRKQYKEGLGDDTLGGVRKETSAQTAKTLRSLAETAPQFSSQATSRITALDRMSTEANLSNMSESLKRSAVTGMGRAAADKTEIMQRQVTAERQYKMMAEEAAGEAIARGSENLVQGIQSLSQ